MKTLNTMVFRDEDKILTRSLYLLKGYKAMKLMNELPNKGWRKISINRLLIKFGYTGASTDSQVVADHEIPALKEMLTC